MNLLKKYSFVLFLLTAISSFLIINLSCEDDVVGPGSEPPPGRRDYVWEVDTLIIPFSTLYSLSGNAPHDLWAVGPGGDLDKTIYHFDGISWQTDGISRSISPLSIWSFNENNIWICGSNGKIWFYNGNTWLQDEEFNQPVDKEIGFEKIWGESLSEIYAIGYSGFGENRHSVIAQYDGSKWALDIFTDFKYDLLHIKRGLKTSTNYFLTGIQFNRTGNDIFGIFKYDGKEIKQLFEGSSGKQSWTFVQEIKNEIYFGIGVTIYNYINNRFEEFLNVGDDKFWTGFYGRNKYDIFLIMSNGISHYNGKNIEHLFNSINKIHILDAVIFEKDIFFLAVDPTIGGNLIIHGNLN